MIKPLLLGIWISIVVGASSYVVADMKASAIAPDQGEEEPYLAGLEYKSLPPLTVPMISGGEVTGYLVGKLVYTADARTLRELPIEPEAFVADEAFRTFYTEGRIEFGKMAKQDIDTIAATIKDRVNARLGAELVKDVLVEQLDYVDRSQIGKPVQGAGGGESSKAAEGASH